MGIATVSDLVSALKHHQLLAPDQLEEMSLRMEGRCSDARSLAKHLVQRRWMTIYQLQQVFQGQAAELTQGPFRILEPLGKGGVSSVYRAWDTVHQRVVALKVIHPDLLSNTEIVGRLQREMQAAQQLNHPNIVRAIDVDLSGQRHYFAMELVDGVDLHRIVELSGPMPIARACNYGRQAALGLQHAHELGLVHRDIKPANLLLVEPNNQIKILDFGLTRLTLAKGSGANLNLTVQGSLIGTADYLAPEQARNPSGVDIRADIYSLGCTLFHLLAGSPPFPSGSALQKVYKHQREEPSPTLRELRPEVPEELAAVVKRMMAKLPEERFRFPAAVAAALAPFARETAPSPVDAPTPPATA
jgi:serine/threonine protein kinase